MDIQTHHTSKVDIGEATILGVLFAIGRQQYSLPIDNVLEVVRLPALVMLAGAPPTLAGLLNLRDQYLPVLNGRVMVGEPPEHTLESQIIIVGQNTPRLGLLVDTVNTVTLLRRKEHAVLDTHAERFIRGVVTHGCGAAVMLDTNGLAELAPQSLTHTACL